MIYVIYSISILVGLALLLWFIADILRLWLPKHFENVKRCIRLGGLRKSDEDHVTHQRIRDAGLYIAKHSLRAGKTVTEAVEDAISHIRNRTKGWKNDDEVRRWLTSQLSTQAKTGFSIFDVMKNSSWKRDMIVLLGGILVGLSIGWGTIGLHDRYSIHSLSGPSRVRAIKLDKKTGETWTMDVHGRWTNGPPSETGVVRP
jgi:hypothetical protein